MKARDTGKRKKNLADKSMKSNAIEVEISSKIKRAVLQRRRRGGSGSKVTNLMTNRNIAICGVTAKKAYREQLQDNDLKTFSPGDMEYMAKIYSKDLCKYAPESWSELMDAEINKLDKKIAQLDKKMKMKKKNTAKKDGKKDSVVGNTVNKTEEIGDKKKDVEMTEIHDDWIPDVKSNESIKKYYTWVKDKLNQFDTSKDFQGKISLANDLMRRRHQNMISDWSSDIDKLAEHPEYFMNADEAPNFILNDEYNDGFTLTKSQQFLKKFISPRTGNMGLLMFHGVGRGKTCSALNIAANFVDYYEKVPLIIAPEGLQQNFKREIFDENKIDADGTYQGCIDVVASSLQGEKMKDSEFVSKRIKQKYKFITQQILVNRLIEKRKNIETLIKDPDIVNRAYGRHLKELFSNRVIIIDEIHHLRSPGSDRKEIVKCLEDVLRNANNVRLLMLSATPMFNDPTEIVDLMKILMLNDKQSFGDDPIFKDGRLTSHGETKIEYFASNYVSYMPGGEYPENFPLRIRPSDIPDLQGNVLGKDDHPTIKINGDKILDDDKIKHTELYLSEYSNEHGDILSNKSGDNAAMSQNANINWKLTDVFQKDVIDGQLKLTYKDGTSELFSEERFKEFAPKMNTIIQLIKDARGVIIIYSRFLDHGVIPLCVALESFLGYANYENNKNLLKNNSGSSNSSKYILLTADESLSDVKKRQDLIQQVNSDDNTEGHKIKVVVINDAISEGYDFKYVRQVHILEPCYNMSKLEQIIGRAIRYRSHIKLNPDDRNTTIFLHCGVYKDRKKESIDYKTYRAAEKKSILIAEVEKLLISNSIDCAMNEGFLNSTSKHRERDVRTSSGHMIKNYRPKELEKCDFDSCHEIKCSRQLPPVDLSSMQVDMFMLQYQIKKLGRRIIAFLLKEKVLYTHIDQIYASFEEDKKMIDISLDFLNKEKIIIELNGTEGHLSVSGDYVHFVPGERPSGNTFQEMSNISREMFNGEKRPDVVDKIHIEVEDAPAEESSNFDYENAIKTLTNRLQKTKLFEEDLDQNIIGAMVIDRIDKNTLELFMKEYVKELNSRVPSNNKLHEQLTKSGYLISVDSNKHIFFNHYDKKFKTLDDDEAGLKDVSQVFINDKMLLETLETIYDKIELTNFVSSRQGTRKGTTDVFMINHTTNKSRVCASINKEEVIKIFESNMENVSLNDEYQKVLAGNSLDKRLICDSIEYILRLKNKFLAPIHEYIVSKK